MSENGKVVLGFEVGTGEAVSVKPGHLIASGITQLSGKTTAEEALISRSGLRAVVFKTKVGETGFSRGTVIAPYFKERCFPAGTMVFSNLSVKAIEQISVGDSVIDADGCFTEVAQTFKDFYDGKLIQIKPHGLPAISMTPNHPLLASERGYKTWKPHEGHYSVGEPKWLLASQLTKKHYLLLPRLKREEPYTIVLIKYLRHGKSGVKIPLQIVVNEDIAWFLGLFLADGSAWAGKSRSFLRFHLDKKDTETQKRVIRILANLGLKARKDEINNCVTVSVGSPLLAKFFRETFCIAPHQKKIPIFIYSLPNQLIKNFLTGWFDGDGCATESKYRFAGITISQQIAYGLMLLGAKIGVPINISLAKAPTSGFRNAKARWMVEIYGDYAIEFGLPYLRNRIRSRKAVKVDQNYLYLPIREIGSIPFSGTVYNFETKAHSYLAPIVSHNSDWQYVSSLLEATLKEKLKFERAWIINVCKNASSLLEVKANIDRKLAEGKLNQLSQNIYTTLQAYFELVLPQLQYAKFSRTLELRSGINIMDLERYSVEIQSLVIRSVLETVLNEFKDTIIVLPEAWKFLPQGRGNPCKYAAESLIRQGATNGNYLWIDSQDMAGVDKTPLKQVSTWILGLQQERNEVEHTLDQIPLPRHLKPKPDEIMTLKKGHFILATPDFTKRVYVQPSWLDAETARKVALGEVDVETIKKPESLVSITIGDSSHPELIDFDDQRFYARISQDLVEIRKDFFAKIDQIQTQVDGQGKAIMDLKAHEPKVNIEEVTSRVLQKVPLFNKQEILDELVKRIPRMTGTVTYEVSPLEKLQKDFQEYAKAEIVSNISNLDEEQKRILRFTEAIGKSTNVTEILEKCLFLNTTSGGTRQRVNEKLASMVASDLIRKDDGGRFYANLKGKIMKLMELHNATSQEIDAVYNHALNGISEGAS